MRIFTRKAFGFRRPDSKNSFVRTRPLAFEDVPDWVENDPLFQAALASGDIEVMTSIRQEENVTAKKAKKGESLADG